MRALVDRFPALASLARVDLGVVESPVQRWRVDGTTLLIKRDDLSSPALGGNKVRALELLLAGVPPAATVLTVGATGSTHALSVARHGAALGLRTAVITWPQESHDVARAVARELAARARVTAARSVAEAYLRAGARRLGGGVHWVPAGGSVPLGALAHAAAGVELADQLAREKLAAPEIVVVPLGSGGTAAGLLVGFAVAGLRTRVVGVRVVPRAVANRRRVLRLARRTAALLGRLAGVEAPRIERDRLEVEGGAYGGAYGRETEDGRAAAAALGAAGGPALEGTYSAKAFGVALERARRPTHGPVLFWLTFDGRWISDGTSSPPPAARRHSSPSSR